MGIFSSLFQKKVVVPTLDQQKAQAQAYLDSFLRKVNATNSDEEGDVETELYKIAGITFYCSSKDTGVFVGTTIHDADNPKDKKAIGIYAFPPKGEFKPVGYLPKDKKRTEEEVASMSGKPVVGYIREFTDSEGERGICGCVKLYYGIGKKLNDAMVEDIQLLQGLFKGYYKENTLEELGDRPEWLIEKHFEK